MTEKIELLKISEIVRNPYQPRTVFDADKLQELADSIKENGVLQPIIVRQSSLLGYELLAGERRFLASQMAGLQEIPAIVRNYSDEEMMTLSILENLQRENLNPIEEARSLSVLTEKLGLTHAEIGKSLGKSRSYVSNSLRILSLPQEILQLVEQNQLSLAHARTLLAVPTKIQQRSLAQRVVREKMSVRQLENLIYGKKKTENNSKKNSVSSHSQLFWQTVKKS